jgi:hypothetical protein
MIHDTIYRLVQFSSNKTTRHQSELFNTIIGNDHGFLANYNYLDFSQYLLEEKASNKTKKLNVVAETSGKV